MLGIFWKLGTNIGPIDLILEIFRLRSSSSGRQIDLARSNIDLKQSEPFKGKNDHHDHRVRSLIGKSIILSNEIF